VVRILLLLLQMATLPLEKHRTPELSRRAHNPETTQVLDESRAIRGRLE
jgi:hypothetical protein